MTRILLIDDHFREIVATLKARAAGRPSSYDDLMRMMKQGMSAAKQPRNPMNDDLTARFTGGYRVIYTHEYQRPDVLCAHISISVEDAKPGMGPHPTAVDTILEAFGFKHRLDSIYCYLTKDGDDIIIECIEPMDGDYKKLMGSAHA